MTDPVVHRYRTAARWSGSTGQGYEVYDRDHSLTTEPATTTLELSSDPAFRGDPGRLNPEELLVAAASSCQLLSFLAVAARARLDVIDYVDAAEGEMPEAPTPRSGPMSITRIVLHPVITIGVPRTASGPGTPPSDSRFRHLVEVAHRECFIANSLRTEIVVEPEMRVVDTDRPGR